MARRTSVVASPLKLPEAPKTYDKRDQDHTRRLIELALIAYTQQLTGVINDITVASTVGKEFIPVSPIHGTVGTFGDVGGTPGLVQLQNPADSGVIMVIYELTASQEGSANQQIRLRITDFPATQNGGVATTATLTRRDENDAAAIKGTLKGYTIMTPNPPFATESASFWETARQAAQPQNNPIPIIWPGHHPIVLLPGMTLECTEPLTGATARITVYACWDELPLSTIIGTPMPGDPTRVIDSCWAGIRTAGSVNGAPFIQFFNPGPHFVKITGLYVLCDATNFTAARRTSSPINTNGAGSTPITAKVQRMNRGSIEPINGILRATNFTSNGDNFHSTNNPGSSFWRDKGKSISNGLPYNALIAPWTAPLTVKPNSAVEVSCAGNGVGLVVGAFFMWDEVESL